MEPLINASMPAVVPIIVKDWSAAHDNKPQTLQTAMNVVRRLMIAMTIIGFVVVFMSFVAESAQNHGSSTVFNIFPTNVFMQELYRILGAILISFGYIFFKCAYFPITLWGLSSLTAYIKKNNLNINQILRDYRRNSESYFLNKHFFLMMASYELLLVVAAFRIKNEEEASRITADIILNIISELFAPNLLVFIVYFATDLVRVLVQGFTGWTHIVVIIVFALLSVPGIVLNIIGYVVDKKLATAIWTEAEKAEMFPERENPTTATATDKKSTVKPADTTVATSETAATQRPSSPPETDT